MLMKQHRRNATKLGRVGHALGDIAGFIDMTEVEQGVLPERGRDSSRRVEDLRTKAMRVLDSSAEQELRAEKTEEPAEAEETKNTT